MISCYTSRIKEKALELGFDLVGIAPAVQFSEADFYRQWIEKGYAGEMEYLTRNVKKREDCRLLFPPAQSVIVCGMSYHALIADPADIERQERPPRFSKTLKVSPASQGKISKYALGEDYHVVLKKRLYALLEFIRQEVNSLVEAKVCVDTVPILEKMYGKYAGLGWIGKNSCLINQRYGSWFFLGELLINLDLEYDTPVPDRCGTCTRCVNACPTRAFAAPRILDARKCISYLTIEYKGIIPTNLRPAIGNNVFGCDCCQEVCPWNQKAEVAAHSKFLPRAPLLRPDLEWLLMLSPESFKRFFKNNPVKRAKLPGLLRNTVTAIGNSGNPNFIPLLNNVSGSADITMLPHIKWAITQLSNRAKLIS